jgi:TM2 domain-containing membrane protein YozV
LRQAYPANGTHLFEKFEILSNTGQGQANPRLNNVFALSGWKWEVKQMNFSQNHEGNYGYGTPPVPPVKVKPALYPQDGTHRRYVKYVPVGYATSHNKTVGYLLWIIGFTGAHRFYYGKPISGAIWFFTAGLLGIGWVVDLFLIPSMNREANLRFRPGSMDYGVAWLFLAFLGWLGIHRFYQGKLITGFLYLISAGLFGVGIVYDVCTLNRQLDEVHQREATELGLASGLVY